MVDVDVTLRLVEQYGNESEVLCLPLITWPVQLIGDDYHECRSEHSSCYCFVFHFFQIDYVMFVFSNLAFFIDVILFFYHSLRF